MGGLVTGRIGVPMSPRKREFAKWDINNMKTWSNSSFKRPYDQWICGATRDQHHGMFESKELEKPLRSSSAKHHSYGRVRPIIPPPVPYLADRVHLLHNMPGMPHHPPGSARSGRHSLSVNDKELRSSPPHPRNGRELAELHSLHRHV